MKSTNQAQQPSKVFVPYNEVSILEVEMTNCAYGYEHILDALDHEDQLGWKAVELTQQLEDFKASYYLARERLITLDSKRLRDFECDLMVQKSHVFSRVQYLQ
jgi:hypothetical protein